MTVDDPFALTVVVTLCLDSFSGPFALTVVVPLLFCLNSASAPFDNTCVPFKRTYAVSSISSESLLI